jgi:hypothetical protein
MTRRLSDLYPYLVERFTENRKRLESGDHPPVEKLFNADIVAAAWEEAGSKVCFKVIKGEDLFRKAMSGEHLDCSLDVLPCRNRADADQARLKYGDTVVH